MVFALIVAAVSYSLTAYLIRRLRILDVPNDRSSHTTVKPRGGGIAIVAAFALGICVIQSAGRIVPIRTGYFISFFVSLAIIAVVSFYDDVRPRDFRLKLVVQVVAIGLAMFLGNVIDLIRMPWLGEMTDPLLLYPLTFLWFLGMLNAYNFLDGLDGMAAGTAVVVGCFFSFIAFREGSHFAYLVSLSLAAAALGFLAHNWSPARIFMGDVGSAFIGFAFALIAVMAARYDHGHTSLFVMPLLLFHFIFDAAFSMTCRAIRGENITQAHRTHIYQLLNRLGLSHSRVSGLYALLAAIQGLAALWMVTLPREWRLTAFLPFFVVYLTSGIVIRRRASMAGLI